MSGDGKRFDLTEGVIEDIGNTYGQYMSETAEATGTFIGGVVPVAERTMFEPIVKMVNACIKHNNDVKDCIESNFEEWKIGSSSLVKLVETLKGGDAAASTAENVQSTLESKINEMLKKEEELQIATANPNVNTPDFEELENITKTYSDALVEIYDKAEKDISGKADENTVYNSIKGPVVATLKVVTSSFEKVADLLTKARESFAETHASAAEALAQAAEESIRAAEQKGQEVFESYSEEIDY